jgi:hypothetical protein
LGHALKSGGLGLVSVLRAAWSNSARKSLSVESNQSRFFTCNYPLVVPQTDNPDGRLKSGGTSKFNVCSFGVSPFLADEAFLPKRFG